MFKYPNSTGPNATTAFLQLNNTLTCKTVQYHPAIFTAGDDDRFGVTLFGIWGNYSADPSSAAYANPAIAMGNFLTLSNCRFFYANVAISCSGVVTVEHSQFCSCVQGISIVGHSGGCGSGSSALQATLNNCLMAGVAYPLEFTISGGSGTLPVLLIHCTIDSATYLKGPGTGCYVTFAATNSIFANVGGLSQDTGGIVSITGDYNGFYDTPFQFGVHHPVSPTAPFQSSDAGYYYLNSTSGFQNAGNASISSTLLNSLKTRSTHPPIALPTWMELTGELTLFPQIPRYISGAPDLGYHYDVLDFTVAGLTVEGGTVTVLPGTAVGLRNDARFWLPGSFPNYWRWYIGFDLWEGSTLVSRGTPNKPNVFAADTMVQEAPMLPDFPFQYSTVAFQPDYLDTGLGEPPVLDVRFSNSYLGAGDYHLYAGLNEYELVNEISDDCSMYWSARDCNFVGGRITLGSLRTTYDPATSTSSPDIPNAVGSVSWINNLFDRVWMDVEPASWWVNPPAVMSLSLEAYNNLFHGGRLRLLPLTSSRNWSFRDNLFDKVVFEQDTDWPLDHDHNGYWPCTTGELAQIPPDPNGQGANSATLLASTGGNTDPSSDKTLTVAPAYQTGPLGSFYLSSTLTPALFNSGSRSPGDAGLYHYTSRTDQTKDADQTAVNIGFHYIATLNSSSTSPKDSDTDGPDGIPDYVEDANGNGQWDSGLETDWTKSHTDTDPNTGTPIADSVNAIFDDVDLDGDGMVGRVEKALGKNPLLADNPLAPTQVTTGEEPDVCTFGVGINFDALSAFGNLQLLVDGSAASFQECDRAESASCLLAWNTTFDWPGRHILQSHLLLNGQTRKGSVPDRKILSAVGPLISFEASNVVKFNPFYAEYHDGVAVLYADLPELDASYYIELRTPAGTPIRTISNSTSTGKIRETWTLADDNYTGDATAIFNVTLTDSGVAASHNLHLTDSQVVLDGTFDIAYAWNDGVQANGVTRDCVQHGVVDVLLTPGWAGGSDNYYNSDYNDFSWSGGSGSPGWLESNSQVTELLNNLAITFTRNFHFDGHGSQTGVGDDDMVTMSSGAVSSALQNAWGPRVGLIRHHPYRFVFLNACNTADTADWAYTFGIYTSLGPDDISDWPLGVQAFLGWFGKPRAPTTDQEWRDMGDTYAVFYGAWMQGFSLTECISIASRKHPPAPFDVVTLDFPLGIKYTLLQQIFSDYPNLMPNNFHPVIYGYPWIKRSGYELPP